MFTYIYIYSFVRKLPTFFLGHSVKLSPCLVHNRIYFHLLNSIGLFFETHPQMSSGLTPASMIRNQSWFTVDLEDQMGRLGSNLGQLITRLMALLKVLSSIIIIVVLKALPTVLSILLFNFKLHLWNKSLTVSETRNSD